MPQIADEKAPQFLGSLTLCGKYCIRRTVSDYTDFELAQRR
jgi:hypothetical protein